MSSPITSQQGLKPSVLYISYDGMLEPLGQSQVWRYLSALSEKHRIVLLSYEKEADWADVEARERFRAEARGRRVVWVPLRYHKKPSAAATAYDIVLGILAGSYLALRHRVDIVHARSYVSSVIALSLKRLLGLKFLFDMRGFWADERVDGGIWPAGGGLYRAAKGFERRFLLGADLVVSLTRAAVDEMRRFDYLQQRMPRFEVITTCADLDQFKPGRAGGHREGERPLTLGYVGSAGVWYLFDESLRCFKVLRRALPDARLHILNRGEHPFIRERLEHHGIDPAAVVLDTADHAGVARAMARMDAGIFFIKPVYSKTASAPTKLGEFLGCGVPCLGNAGVGDMASILEDRGVGIALKEFSEEAMEEAVGRLLGLLREPGIRERCRRVALEEFSLDHGVRSYAGIYAELLGGPAVELAGGPAA